MRLLTSSRSLVSVSENVKALEPAQAAVVAALRAVSPSGNMTLAQAKEVIAEDATLSLTAAEVKDQNLSWTWDRLSSKAVGKFEKAPITVAIMGNADVAFRIAAGSMLGVDQPVKLTLVGGDASLKTELEACEFPLLSTVTVAASANGLSGAKFALLLGGDMGAGGAALRGSGALVGVLGTTAAAVVANAAGDGVRVTSITRATQMAAEVELAKAAAADFSEVNHVIAWGDGVADLSHATVGGMWANKFLPSLLPGIAPNPGLIADAAVAHMKDWALGSEGRWVSMGVPAVDDFNMGEGFFYSVPCVCHPGGDYKRVGGISISPDAATAMEKERVSAT